MANYKLGIIQTVKDKRNHAKHIARLLESQPIICEEQIRSYLVFYARGNNGFYDPQKHRIIFLDKPFNISELTYTYKKPRDRK